MSKRTMALTTPKDLGDFSIKRFQVQSISIFDDFIVANLSPSSFGDIKIWLGANPNSKPQDIVLPAPAVTKVQNFIDAVEDACLAKVDA